MLIAAGAASIPILGAMAAAFWVIRQNQKRELAERLEAAREAAERRAEEKAAAHGFELQRVDDLNAKLGDIPEWRLGPIAQLLKDPSVTEIMVNRHDQIFAEREGIVLLTGLEFHDEKNLMEAIRRISQTAGRRIDESSPMVDARLADGSRVNAIINPVAISGPSLTIRKFSQGLLSIQDLVEKNTMSVEMAEFLHKAVSAKKNILVSGGTGSGKTTLLNLLLSMISDKERLVTIEDAAELKVSQPNVVSLESRPANLEGRGAVTIRQLVVNALRMRPDRIIVGECRGPEALDMLQAMNTGHAGSLTTIHANTPKDALYRLEMLILMAGMELPDSAIRRQIASAIDLVVQAKRLADGSRKVVHIAQITGVDDNAVKMNDLFFFREDRSKTEGSKIEGTFARANALV